jgi:hypothetical protein
MVAFTIRLLQAYNAVARPLTGNRRFDSIYYVVFMEIKQEMITGSIILAGHQPVYFTRLGQLN